MTRIAVIGNAGGGKSTLCRRLSKARELPHFAADVLQWRPGWQPVSKAEFEAIHSSLLTRETWIIDGFGPWEEIEKRFDRADTIIFVDHSLWRHYWWATKRQIASIFHGRADGPEGCPAANRFAVPLTWPLRGHPLPLGRVDLGSARHKPFSPGGRRCREAADEGTPRQRHAGQVNST